MTKDLRDAIIRFAIAIVLFVNVILSTKGINPIPVLNESMIAEGVSIIGAFLAMLWGLWKNNNITNGAQRKKQIAELILAGGAVLQYISDVKDDLYDEVSDEEIKLIEDDPVEDDVEDDNEEEVE